MDYCSLSACTSCIQALILPSCSLTLAISAFTSFFMISTISALGTLYLEPACSFLRVTVPYLVVLASEQLAYCYLACFFYKVSDSLLLRLVLPLDRECLEVLSTMYMQSLSFSFLAFLSSTLLCPLLLSLPSFDEPLLAEAGGFWTGSSLVALCWTSSSRSMTSFSSFSDSITLISTISSAGVSVAWWLVAARSANVLVVSQSKVTADLLRLYMLGAGRWGRRFLPWLSSNWWVLSVFCGLLVCLSCKWAVG